MAPLSCQVKSPSHTSHAERHAVPCSFCSLGAMPFAVVVTACRMAWPGHTTQPRLFRHAAKVLVPSGTLHRIALNSRNMSRRSFSSNTRSCSQSLVLVVVARLGPKSVQKCGCLQVGCAPPVFFVRAGATRPMVYTPALPKPTHATPMPVLAMANSVHPSQSCGAVRAHPSHGPFLSRADQSASATSRSMGLSSTMRRINRALVLVLLLWCPQIQTWVCLVKRFSLCALSSSAFWGPLCRGARPSAGTRKQCAATFRCRSPS